MFLLFDWFLNVIVFIDFLFLLIHGLSVINLLIVDNVFFFVFFIVYFIALYFVIFIVFLCFLYLFHLLFPLLFSLLHSLLFALVFSFVFSFLFFFNVSVIAFYWFHWFSWISDLLMFIDLQCFGWFWLIFIDFCWLL